MGQSSDELLPCPKPGKAKPPLPLPWPPLPWPPPLKAKPPPPLLLPLPFKPLPTIHMLDEHSSVFYPVLPKGYVVSLPGPPPPKPPPAQPPQQLAVAYLNLGPPRGSHVSESESESESETDASMPCLDPASESDEQAPSVKAVPFKKPPPPLPPFEPLPVKLSSELSRRLPPFEPPRSIRCQCACGLPRSDACEKRVRLPLRFCSECMDFSYISDTLGAVCRCRCRECK